MLRVLYFSIAVFLLYSCGTHPPSNTNINQVSEFIDNLKQEYAPDKRVAIWDLEAYAEGAELIVKGRTNLPQAFEQLKSQLDAASITWVDSIRQLPDQDALKGQTYGIVKLSACNIRSNPKHSAELATQSTLGTILKVYEKNGDWYLVQTPDGYLGWLDAGGLTLLDENQFQQWLAAPKVIYLADMGFSYQSPRQEKRVSDLLAGNILRLITQEEEWTKVGYPDGRMAYIQSSEVENFADWLQSRSPQADNILNTAQAMLGRPYLWGGTSGKAFDCSGFTKTVFYLNGLILPRDASQQVHVGQAIETNDDINNLIPGDLLFFGRPASAEQKERITHVAIYMGDFKIIHAAGAVKIESLNPDDPDFAPERLKTFVRAKRMLETPEDYGIPMIAKSEWYQREGEL